MGDEKVLLLGNFFWRKHGRYTSAAIMHSSYDVCQIEPLCYDHRTLSMTLQSHRSFLY